MRYQSWEKNLSTRGSNVWKTTGITSPENTICQSSLQRIRRLRLSWSRRPDLRPSWRTATLARMVFSGRGSSTPSSTYPIKSSLIHSSPKRSKARCLCSRLWCSTWATLLSTRRTMKMQKLSERGISIDLGYFRSTRRARGRTGELFTTITLREKRRTSATVLRGLTLSSTRYLTRSRNSCPKTYRTWWTLPTTSTTVGCTTQRTITMRGSGAKT